MSRKLLLADDSVTIRKVVEIIFANEDFTLEVVGDGDAALEAVRSDRPALLMADVVMPGKNGYDLCRAVKQDPDLQSVSVLLLTGTFEAFDEARAVAAGADDWIAKPFESQALIDKVEALLSRAPAAAPAPTVAEPEPVAAALIAEAPEFAAAAADMWEELAEIEAPLETSAAPEPAFAEAAEAFGADVAFDDADAPLGAGGDDAFDEDALDAFLAEPEAEEDVFAAAEEAGQAFALAGEDLSADPPEAADPWLEEAEEEDVLFLGEDDILEDDFDAASVTATEEFAAAEPLVVDDRVAVEAAGASSAIDEEPAWPAAEEKPVAFVSEEEPASIAAEEPLTAFAEEESLASVAEELPAEAVAAEQALPSAADAAPAEASGREGLAFFQNSGLISRLAQPAVEPEETFEPAPAAAGEVGPGASVQAVEAQAGALSEEELTRIVERVAATVIERLAGSVLERIAWEVVPDLAESMIREEIRRITENA